MRYLSHKTADAIMEHNYDESPLTLYSGIYPAHEEFESLMSYVSRAARHRNCRFVIKGTRTVTISKEK